MCGFPRRVCADCTLCVFRVRLKKNKATRLSQSTCSGSPFIYIFFWLFCFYFLGLGILLYFFSQCYCHYALLNWLLYDVRRHTARFSMHSAIIIILRLYIGNVPVVYRQIYTFWYAPYHIHLYIWLYLFNLLYTRYLYINIII